MNDYLDIDWFAFISIYKSLVQVSSQRAQMTPCNSKGQTDDLNKV